MNKTTRWLLAGGLAALLLSVPTPGWADDLRLGTRPQSNGINLTVVVPLFAFNLKQITAGLYLAA
jgi:hypothetical protein